MKARGWRMVEAKAPLEPVEWEIPAPGADAVVIEIAGCGVCHTDLGYLFEDVPVRGGLPRILGHEIAGTVSDAGENYRALIGTAVIVPAVMPCGECDACRRGRSGICAGQVFPGNDIDGGFASHVTVPGRGLCPVSDTADLTTLAVIADAVTTPLNAVVRSGLEKGQVAVVVGAGGVGAFAVQIAAARGAHVIALDVDAERLTLAKEHGAAVALNVADTDLKSLKKKLRGTAKENGWPTSEWIIFETSGTSAGQETAFGLVNFGATLMVVGYTTDSVNLRLSNLMAFEARALGVWGCPPELYPEAVDLVTRGDVQLEPFIERRSMSQINEVLSDIHARRIRRRVVLTP